MLGVVEPLLVRPARTATASDSTLSETWSRSKEVGTDAPIGDTPPLACGAEEGVVHLALDEHKTGAWGRLGVGHVKSVREAHIEPADNRRALPRIVTAQTGRFTRRIAFPQRCLGAKACRGGAVGPLYG